MWLQVISQIKSSRKTACLWFSARGSSPFWGFARSSLRHLRTDTSTARYFWLQIMCELKSDITISKWETLRCETIANQTINTVKLLWYSLLWYQYCSSYTGQGIANRWNALLANNVEDSNKLQDTLSLFGTFVVWSLLLGVSELRHCTCTAWDRSYHRMRWFNCKQVQVGILVTSIFCCDIGVTSA